MEVFDHYGKFNANDSDGYVLVLPSSIVGVFIFILVGCDITLCNHCNRDKSRLLIINWLHLFYWEEMNIFVENCSFPMKNTRFRRKIDNFFESWQFSFENYYLPGTTQNIEKKSLSMETKQKNNHVTYMALPPAPEMQKLHKR